MICIHNSNLINMVALKCIIIEDDWASQKILEAFIQRMPQLNLQASFTNSALGLQVLQMESIDILFLDIRMPQLTGIELLKKLEHRPATIFVTSHAEYALDAFDLGVVDFLLKPFTFDRFEASVNKAIDTLVKDKRIRSLEDFIFLRENRQNVKVLINDIRYIEAYGNYTKVYLEEGKMLLSNDTMTQIEDRMKPYNFIRIHKSFLANVINIRVFDTKTITLTSGEILPIGFTYKNQVAALFKGSAKTIHESINL
jgi:DNA-binding LytR/AlgR family response regulator